MRNYRLKRIVFGIIRKSFVILFLICIAGYIPGLKEKFLSIVDVSSPVVESSFVSEEGWENYSQLDSLGRVGEATALLHKSMMPTVERESIADVKPSGWHTIRYDDLIEDKYLYNRCHLIGYQLTGQNANPLNLVTCTRACNLNMVPYENEVASYLRLTGNHIEYRVTPNFEGDNLVASGITIEAHSVEDDVINFTVYIPNEQPGIGINYSNGDSWTLSE